MPRAAEHVAKDLTSIGFETSIRPTGGASDRGGEGRRGQPTASAARLVLWPLRRAAGRSPRHVGGSALRTPHCDASRRPQDHRRARGLRRQGPSHDLRRGLPRLQGGHRPIAAADHHADRRRGGVRLQPFVRFREGPCRRAQSRSGAGVRYQHVGSGNADGDHLAARARLRGGADHVRGPRPAFRVVRRCRAKSAARPCAHSCRHAR